MSALLVSAMAAGAADLDADPLWLLVGKNADEVRRVIEAGDDGEDCAAVTDEAFFRICSALLEHVKNISAKSFDFIHN